MKTTVRITRALVSLGLLFHCISNSMADGVTATPTPTAAAAAGVPTSTKAPIVTSPAVVTTTTPMPIATTTITAKPDSPIDPTTKPTTPAASTATSAAIVVTTKPTAVTQAPTEKVSTAVVAAKDSPAAQPTPAPKSLGSAAPSTPATPTQSANIPATTLPAATKSGSPDANAPVPTQNASPALTAAGKTTPATPTVTNAAKQSADGTSGNAISTPVPTSPVKTTFRTSNPSEVKPTEKKVTTSPLLQSTVKAPSAVSTTSKTTPTIPTTTPPPTTTTTTPTIPTTTTPPPPTTVPATEILQKIITFTKGENKNKEEKELDAVCAKLMEVMHAATCTITVRQHKGGKPRFQDVQIAGTVDPNVATRYYDEITKANSKVKGDNSTLIAILASCGALLVMIVGLAIYAHHRKPYNENQQHLTEELHTVENGYHDNPTLEVMEVPAEMHEKTMQEKMALNGEFNDSWIVPIDNLLKEDLPDEEDTHL